MASALSAGASAAIKYSIAILGRAPTDAELSSFAAAYKGASATASEDAVASAVAASTAGTTALKPGVFSATKQAQVILGNHGVTNDAVVAYVASMIDGTNADAGKVALPLGTVARVVANFFSSWTSTPSNPYNDVFMAGSTALKTASTAAESAILNPTPVVPPVSTATYTLTGPVSVDEGKSAIVTLATKNVAAGSSVGYVISGVDATDVNSLVGSATVGVDGNAYIQIDAKADGLTEGVETMTVTAAGATVSVKINDTSVLAPKVLKYTTSIDDLVGSDTDDTVSASVSTTASTLTAGDVLNGGAGSDTLSITMEAGLAAAGTASPNLTSVENLVVRNLSAGAQTVDLVQTSGITSLKLNASTQDVAVTNAPLAATYAIENTPLAAGASADITVTYNTIELVGKNDVAAFAVKGAGSKVGVAASNPAVLGVGNTAGVEGVSVSTSGTNYIAINGGGTATKTLTITGSGTNEISLDTAAGDMNATLTIDASASTGQNTIVLGTDLTSSDVVKGGSGTDTLDIRLGSATGVSVSGVEKLIINDNSTSAGVLDFASDPAFATIELRDATDTDSFQLAGLKTGFTLAFVGQDISAGTSPTYLLGSSSNDVTFGTIQLNTAMAGTADTLAIVLGNQSVAPTTGYQATVKASGVETVNITQNDINSNASTTLSLTDPGLKSLAATSSGSVAITLDTRTSSAPLSTAATSTDYGNTVTSVDLSAVVGTGSITTGTKGLFAAASSFKTAQGGTTHTFGEEAATDVITITGNKGVDNITTGTIGSFVAKLADGNDIFSASGIATAGNGTVNVDGEAGNDSITGGINNDTLSGGDGADTLTGGGGSDVLDGGLQGDTYVINLGSSIVAGAGQTSTIFVGSDFGTGETLKVTIGGTTYSQLWGTDVGTTLTSFVTAFGTSIRAATGGITGVTVSKDANADALVFTANTLATTSGGVTTTTGYTFTAPTATVVDAGGQVAATPVVNVRSYYDINPASITGWDTNGDIFQFGTGTSTSTVTAATVTYVTSVANSLSLFAASTQSVGSATVQYTDLADSDLTNGVTTPGLRVFISSTAGTNGNTATLPVVYASNNRDVNTATTLNFGTTGVSASTTTLTANVDAPVAGKAEVAASASDSRYTVSSANVVTSTVDLVTFGASDILKFSTAVTVTAQAAGTNSDGLAVISSTGIVTFDDGPPATLKSALDQIAAAVNASGAATAAGEAALFTFGGKTYLFVSDAANGLTLGDAIVELVGVSTTLTSGITLSATGDIIGVG